MLDYIKELVVKILIKGLDNFQGQSTASTVWFNIDHEWFKKRFLHLNQTYIKKTFEMNIEVQDIETYKIFLVPLDSTKLNLPMRNDSVTQN